MQSTQSSYDKALGYDPNGRLYQVEYAREAVKKGSTTIGVKFKDGVILIVDKKAHNRLIEPDSIEKIYDINGFIGCATSGLVADGRAVVNWARDIAGKHSVNYGENIPVAMLVRQIGDILQELTWKGYRPFGTSMLMAGTDDTGIHLFETDPSGAVSGYKATCIGLGRNTVLTLFDEEYKDNMTFDAAFKLGLKGLLSTQKEGSPTPDEVTLNAANIEVGVSRVGEKFRRLEEAEIKKVISKL